MPNPYSYFVRNLIGKSQYLDKKNMQEILNLFILKSPNICLKPYNLQKHINGDLVYVENIFGSRAPNHQHDTEMLTLGCSQTYGMGIKYHINTWSNMLAKKLNVKYTSLAIPGTTVLDQVVCFFNYVQEFGNPKYVFALFPPLSRFSYLNNSTTMSLHPWQDPESYKRVTHEPVQEDEIPKILKQPYPLEYVITDDLRYFYNIQFVLMLLQYCRNNNIKIFFGSWDKDFNIFIKLINSFYENAPYPEYIDCGIYDWHIDFKHKICFPTNLNEKDKFKCHQEYQNMPEFDFGLDRLFGIERSHMGMHKHLHVADSFLKALKDKNAIH